MRIGGRQCCRAIFPRTHRQPIIHTNDEWEEGKGVQNPLGLDLATWTVDWAGLMVSSKQAHPRHEATEAEE